MRQSCWSCCTKHLGEAAIFQTELKPYPSFAVYVIGCLSHASMEIEEYHPELASLIRDWRLRFEKNHNTKIPYEELYSYLQICEGTHRQGLALPDIIDYQAINIDGTSDPVAEYEDSINRNMGELGKVTPGPAIPDLPIPEGYQLVTYGLIEADDLVQYNEPGYNNMRFAQGPVTGSLVGKPVNSPEVVSVIRKLPDTYTGLPPLDSSLVPIGWTRVMTGCTQEHDQVMGIGDTEFTGIHNWSMLIGMPVSEFTAVIRKVTPSAIEYVYWHPGDNKPDMIPPGCETSSDSDAEGNGPWTPTECTPEDWRGLYRRWPKPVSVTPLPKREWPNPSPIKALEDLGPVKPTPAVSAPLEYVYWKPGDIKPNGVPVGCQIQVTRDSWDPETDIPMGWTVFTRRWPKPEATQADTLADKTSQALLKLKHTGELPTVPTVLEAIQPYPDSELAPEPPADTHPEEVHKDPELYTLKDGPDKGKQITIPEGWCVVTTGVIQSGDQCWCVAGDDEAEGFHYAVARGCGDKLSNVFFGDVVAGLYCVIRKHELEVVESDEVGDAPEPCPPPVDPPIPEGWYLVTEGDLEKGDQAKQYMYEQWYEPSWRAWDDPVSDFYQVIRKHPDAFPMEDGLNSLPFTLADVMDSIKVLVKPEYKANLALELKLALEPFVGRTLTETVKADMLEAVGKACSHAEATPVDADVAPVKKAECPEGWYWLSRYKQTRDGDKKYDKATNSFIPVDAFSDVHNYSGAPYTIIRKDPNYTEPIKVEDKATPSTYTITGGPDHGRVVAIPKGWHQVTEGRIESGDLLWHTDDHAFTPPGESLGEDASAAWCAIRKTVEHEATPPAVESTPEVKATPPAVEATPPVTEEATQGPAVPEPEYVLWNPGDVLPAKTPDGCQWWDGMLRRWELEEAVPGRWAAFKDFKRRWPKPTEKVDKVEATPPVAEKATPPVAEKATQGPAVPDGWRKVDSGEVVKYDRILSVRSGDFIYASGVAVGRPVSDYNFVIREEPPF